MRKSGLFVSEIFVFALEIAVPSYLDLDLRVC